LKNESTTEIAHVQQISIVRVPFRGGFIEAAEQGGEVWVPLKPLCDRLGVSYSRQRKKLNVAPWATVAQKATVAEDGKNREMFCMDLRSLPGWLFGLNASKVAPEARESLVAYQREAAEVLADHFLGVTRVDSAELAEFRYAKILGIRAARVDEDLKKAIAKREEIRAVYHALNDAVRRAVCGLEGGSDPMEAGNILSEERLDEAFLSPYIRAFMSLDEMGRFDSVCEKGMSKRNLVALAVTFLDDNFKHVPVTSRYAKYMDAFWKGDWCADYMLKVGIVEERDTEEGKRFFPTAETKAFVMMRRSAMPLVERATIPALKDRAMAIVRAISPAGS